MLWITESFNFFIHIIISHFVKIHKQNNKLREKVNFFIVGLDILSLSGSTRQSLLKLSVYELIRNGTWFWGSRTIFRVEPAGICNFFFLEL